MSDIRPFLGLRPRKDLASDVPSPPYDVLSSAEARALAQDQPFSFLHVVKAEIDLPAGADVHGDAVYQRSADNFRSMVADGVLVRDPVPCFYVYRLTMGDHVQHGLVVGASVAEYESGAIKKHELTRRAKEDDRARHVETLRANAGPVLFTYRAEPAIRTLIATITQAAPDVDFVAPDHVGHTLWVVDKPEAVAAVQGAFGAVDALYVADGHHRTASAFRVRNHMRDQNPDHTGDEDYNHFLAVVFPDDELQIMGYHRAVRDLNGLTPEALLAQIGQSFVVSPVAAPPETAPRRFGMFLDGAWYALEAKAGTFSETDPVKSLDVSILQDNLLAPLLGIGDPRTDERVDFIGGIRGTGELERRCGVDMAVAFSVHPVSVEQLMSIADFGAIMPPKSTWFEPKLRSGMVVKTF